MDIISTLILVTEKYKDKFLPIKNMKSKSVIINVNSKLSINEDLILKVISVIEGK